MRIPSLAFFSLFAMVPGLALATAGAAITGSTIVQTPNGQVTIAQPAPTTATPPAAAGTADTTTKPADDDAPQAIGFDAKVKRDPNGKVITETQTPSGPTSDVGTLRNDQGMRSDRNLGR